MLGVTLEGKKEIMGIWIGENESSKYWLTLLNELKNRGVENVLIFTIDGLSGFNQAIQAVYPQAIKTLIYTTNPIESLNSNIKRKTKSKGSFHTIDSAFKLLYLAT